MNKIPAIIIDIDGTLAKKGDRGIFDWKKVEVDTLNIPVARLVEGMRKVGYQIILLSGRDSVCRPETERWLKTNNIDYNFLFMRTEKDNRKDTIIKEELYRQHIEGKFRIEFVLDDRDQVVDLWRKKLELTCFQVDYGDF